ncbi:MAG TPA: hypothetical protein VN516_10605 [Candidatus Baltobacteraceae bacterium]|nr:hypothetical protein [Candidatus Baltobacteraceae bacterium]
MKKWKYLTLVVAATGLAFAANGQTTVVQSPADQTTIVQTQPPPPEPVVVSDYDESMYRNTEFSIDGFGTLALGEQDINHISGARIRHNAKLGAGAGVNLFFSKMVGIGADAWSADTTGKFVDNVSGSLIVRFPIGDTGLAPYVFGGGGYEFDRVSQRFGQFGGGLEIRFNPHVGLFVDARYIIAHRTDDWGVGRAGLRFSF